MQARAQKLNIFYISEPLLTFSLYSQFIEAGKTENYSVRLGKVEIMIMRSGGSM